MAGVAVLIKFVHVLATPVSDSAWQTRQQVRSIPPGFYNSGDYVVKKGFKDLAAGMPWPPIEITPQGDVIGDTPAVSIAPQKPSTVVFHVVLFPWNKVFVDGSPLNHKATMAFYNRHAFIVQPGTHSVRYAFEPDAAWLLFKWLSWAGWWIYGCLLAVLAIRDKPTAQASLPEPQNFDPTLLRSSRSEVHNSVKSSGSIVFVGPTTASRTVCKRRRK